MAMDKDLAEMKVKKPKEYAEFMDGMLRFVQSALGGFGYRTPISGRLDELTAQALSAYQKRNRLNVSGELDARTVERISEDYKATTKNMTLLPTMHVFTDLWDRDGYASAKGTWTFTNSEISPPTQVTEITCYRDKGQCVEATAKLNDDYLSVESETWEIERWDEHEIVTKPNQYVCVRAIRKINRSQKQVTGLRSTIKTDGSCSGVASEELHMVLVDGFKIASGLRKEVLDARRRVLIETSK